MNSSGLMSISGSSDIYGDTVTVSDTMDLVADEVSATYTAENGSSSYTTTETGVIVEAPSGQAVVIHTLY